MKQTPRLSTILVADHLGLVQDGIALICEATKRYQVIARCSTGSQALERIRALRPDVAIIDFNISELFSIEILRCVREESLPTRVLLLSARSERKLVLEALRCGAQGVLLKSNSGARLLDALQSILAGQNFVSPELPAMEMLLSLPRRRNQAREPIERLSSREYQVFALLVDGIRAKDIAALLHLSPKTVDTYRANLFRKLEIPDITGLVRFAIQNDVTSLNPEADHVLSYCG